MRFPGTGKGTDAAVSALTLALLFSALPPLAHVGAVGTAGARSLRTKALPRALAASLKPDWRGADLANTGQLASTGPGTAPTQVFEAKPTFGGVTGGVELDASGNIVFNNSASLLFSYAPNGTKNWQFTMGPTSGLPQAGPSFPVISDDGNIYEGTDTGKLYRINAATGAGSIIFSASGNAAIYTTPKIGPDNTLYIGDGGGTFYHLTTAGSTIWTATATGSTQTIGRYAGVTSSAPFSFLGEAALDSSGNVYATSQDTNPAGPGFLGTVYKLSSSGGVAWAEPLQGPASAATVLAPNPAVPGQTLVIVADQAPEVVAYDAATGALVWRFTPPAADAIFASPLVANGVVYVPNSGQSLYALDLATGTLHSAFGSGGVLPLTSGTQSSVVADAAGTLFVMGNDGTLYGYASSGALLWSIPGGTASGQSGATGPKFMSPAIGSDGTIYVGGNAGRVRGFFDAVSATSTAAAQQSSTAAADQTNAAASATAAAGQTQAAGTATAAAQQTATAEVAALETVIALATLNADANNTATAIAGQTQTALAAQSATAGAQQTQTAVALATLNADANNTATAIAAQAQTAAAQTTQAQQTSTASAEQTAAPTLTAAAQTDAAQTATADAQINAAQTATAVAAQQTDAAQSATAAAAQQTDAAQSATAQATQTLAAQTTTAVAQTQAAGTSAAQTAAAQTANTSPTAMPGPASGWSKFRSDLRNTGDTAVTLQPNQPFGQSFAVKISQAQFGGVLVSSPALGPNGTVYQVDNSSGALVALHSDGTIIWRSNAVLGTWQSSASQKGGYDIGSSPAVASNGSIYVGSENAGGGIWRFDAATGSSTQFFGKGQYVGSSVVIGPDGALYAGAYDGTLYGINADGSQRFATKVSCPAGLSPFIQSTPTLDASGNVYIGFGCSSSSAPPQGGLFSVDATGAARWTFRYTDTAGRPGGAMNGAVMLNSSGTKLFSRDTQGYVYSIATNGTLDWATATGTTQAASLAMSPDGNTIYATSSEAPGTQTGLTALSASDGSKVAAVSQPQAGAAASPAVDAAGNIIVPLNPQLLAVYSPNFATEYWQEVVTSVQGTGFFGGPVVAPDGSIYLTNNAGYLIGVKAGIVQQQPTAIPTVPPPPTSQPQASLTPVATIALFTTTPTPKGGTSTPVAQSTAGSAKGSPTPTGKSKGGKTETPSNGTVHGDGYTLTFTGGWFASGNRSQIRIRAKAGVTVKYTIKAEFVYPPAKRSPKAQLGQLPLADEHRAQPATHLLTRSKPQPAATQLSLPPLCAGSVAVTVRDRGTFHLSRKVPRSGSDQFCIRLAAVPARATALRITLTVQVVAGKKAHKAGQAGPYEIKRRPQISRLHIVRITLASVRVRVGSEQTINIEAARTARLTYTLDFGHNTIVRFSGSADMDGYAALRVRLNYKVAKGKRATVTVSVAATQGKTRVSAKVTFTLQG